MRHLSEQNSNFADAQRITTDNALTGLHTYLFRTKIVETIDPAAVRQTVVTLRRVVLFKAIKRRQNRFRNKKANKKQNI